VRTTCVRYKGILHDFMMLNPLRHTAAATGAIEPAIHVLRKAPGTDLPRFPIHGGTTEEERP
jgi:acetyl esterase